MNVDLCGDIGCASSTVCFRERLSNLLCYTHPMGHHPSLNQSQNVRVHFESSSFSKMLFNFCSIRLCLSLPDPEFSTRTILIPN